VRIIALVDTAADIPSAEPAAKTAPADLETISNIFGTPEVLD
jgi:hypothetical protein